MVELFLSKTEVNVTDSIKDAVKSRVLLLEKVEKLIWKILSSDGIYESRLWLCNTLSSIRFITPSDQRRLFMNLLRSKQSKRDVASQLLRMIFEKRPVRVGDFVVKKSNMLEKFFQGNPKRILQWFDHFASTSESWHKKGARAISQFSFINRDMCWDELEWKGKHGQSPAVVATKPHYFDYLDVLRTVENFLENVPMFWQSEELAVSVKDGEIFQMDTQFFVNQFIKLMYEDDLEDVWRVLEEFITEENFFSLAQHILIFLDEQELHFFVKSLSKIYSEHPSNNFECTSSWCEILLSEKSSQFIRLDEFHLLNAVISHGRKLLRLVTDEEHTEDRRIIQELLKSSDGSDIVHWSLIKECSEMKVHLAMKLIGIQSWIVHYKLSEECNTKESFESLFSRNRIKFKSMSDYSLIHPDPEEFSEETDSDDDDKYRKVRKKNKRKSKNKNKNKKRRKNYIHDEIDFDGLLDLGTSFRDHSWLLSTDNYSCSWNIVDLPEHLSKHCFAIWMKSVYFQI